MKKMKRIITSFMIVMLALGLVACGSNRQEQIPVQTTEPDIITTDKDADTDAEPITEPITETESDGKTLIVYYSNTGTTKGVAETIAEYTGGDLAEIQRVTPYENLRDDAEKEIEDGVFPEITVSADSIEEYDTIFVGYPIWFDEAPAMIATFLQNNDFAGKRIIPFCTSSSDSIENSIHIFNELCPDAMVEEGFTANDEADMEPWLEELGLLTENEEGMAEDNGTSKVLVAYFSMPETANSTGMTDDEDNSVVVVDGEVLGNTQYMAYVIQEQAGADIFRIEPETPYPTDHDTLVDQAAEEQEQSARPSLLNEVENIEQYDTIFLGYPNWWGDMPMILYTFLDTYDLSGKTIIPFNTHGGSGFSNTINRIQELEPDANVQKEGLSISRNNIQDAEAEIISWVESLGF